MAQGHWGGDLDVLSYFLPPGFWTVDLGQMAFEK